MDDEDPRIDELDREVARLRARVAELEAIEQRALDELKNCQSLQDIIRVRRILGP